MDARVFIGQAPTVAIPKILMVLILGDLGDPTFQTSRERPPSLYMLGSSAQRQFEAQWKQYYSAREVYGSGLSDGWPENTPLTPAFWHQVTEAFEQNFRQFLEFKWRGVNVETCPPGDCKDNAICALRAGRSENNCVSPHFNDIWSCSRYERLLLLLVFPSARGTQEKGPIACPSMNARAQVSARSFQTCRTKWCVVMLLALLKCIFNVTRLTLTLRTWKKNWRRRFRR